jgi:hypothetical protein
VWDVLSTVLDLLLLATHWRFHVCVLAGVMLGVLATRGTGEAHVLIPTVLGLLGALVGGLWEWRSEHDT